MLSKRIDAHVHVWSDSVISYPRSGPLPGGVPTRFTPEDWFRHASPVGVGRAVLIQVSSYGFDNSYLAQCLVRYPGLFAAVGRVNESGVRPDSSMIELARLGFRGFRILPGNAPQRWLDTDGMEVMWRTGAKYRLAICALVDPDALPGLDRMCARFPETTLVIDHLARIGVQGPPRDFDVAAICALARRKNVFVKVSAFYALDKNGPPYRGVIPTIRRVFETFGPQRLLWGTDSPFQVQGKHTYRDSISVISEELRLSRPDSDALLQKTAESLFFKA